MFRNPMKLVADVLDSVALDHNSFNSFFSLIQAPARYLHGLRPHGISIPERTLCSKQVNMQINKVMIDCDEQLSMCDFGRKLVYDGQRG